MLSAVVFDSVLCIVFIMTKRELYKLPLNRVFEIKDKLYTYLMEKSKCEDGSIIYSWQRKGFPNECFFMHEDIEFDKEDNRFYEKFDVTTSIGMFFLHSDLSYSQMYDLKIVNENSFKKWCQSLNNS